MAELTEEQMEVAVEGIKAVARSFNTITVACVGATSAIAGFGVAYLAFNKRVKAKYAKMAEDEIQVMKDHYMAKADAKIERVQKPDLAEVVNELGYREEPHEVIAVKEDTVVAVVEEVIEDAVVVEPNTRNIFEEVEERATREWDYAAEVKSRTPNAPYIIHEDEFRTNDEGYMQAQLVYYEADDVLADEDDTVIDDQDDMVGVENLERFGHGSGDPSIVFIRNDRRKTDMEIIRSSGSFVEEVHGLKHSAYTEPHTRPREWDG